jgi:hypothetical protein
MKPIYIICAPNDYQYIEDFLVSLQPYLNHIVLPSVEKIDTNSIYIFTLNIPRQFLTCSNIMYLNTEQTSKPNIKLQIQSYLQHRINVLDYDLFQSQSFQSLFHHYVPCTYEPTLRTLLETNTKRFDVGICAIRGSVRRNMIYQALQSKGVRVIDINAWGDKRDTLIAQCKILLNIHYTEEYQIFEHLRCDRWIMAGLNVVSEPSSSDSLLDIAPSMTIVPYEKLVDTICNMLQTDLTLQDTKDEIIYQRDLRCRFIASMILSM